MRPVLQLNPKKYGALIRKIERLAGEKRPRTPRQPKATLGLLGKRIEALWPENRIEVERLVSRLLAEQGEG